MHWCFITAFNDFLKATHVRQKTRVLRQKTRVLQQNVKIYSLVFTILACAWQLQKKVLWLIICRLSGNNRPITDYLKNGRLIGFADYLPINRLIPKQELRVPTQCVDENKEVPDCNIGVPPVRKYANYRTLYNLSSVISQFHITKLTDHN